MMLRTAAAAGRAASSSLSASSHHAAAAVGTAVAGLHSSSTTSSSPSSRSSSSSSTFFSRVTTPSPFPFHVSTRRFAKKVIPEPKKLRPAERIRLKVTNSKAEHKHADIYKVRSDEEREEHIAELTAAAEAREEKALAEAEAAGDVDDEGAADTDRPADTIEFKPDTNIGAGAKRAGADRAIVRASKTSSAVIERRDAYTRKLDGVDPESFVLADTIDRLITGGEPNWADKLSTEDRLFLANMGEQERSDFITDMKRVSSYSVATQREINRARIAAVIERWASKPGDTGSSAVQVAVMSERLKIMEEHSRTHGKDKACYRHRAALLHRRRKALKYMRRTDYEGFKLCQDYFDVTEQEIAWF